MKKNIFTVMLIFLAAIGYCQDTVTIYYDAKWKKINDWNSAVFYSKGYQNPDGLWTVTDHFKSGRVQMTGFYKSLKNQYKQGLFTYYYESGIKESEGYFKDNLMDGEWKYWNEKGRLTSKQLYKRNIIQQIESYHPNGTVKQKGSIKNNQKDGKWFYYDYNGRLIFEGLYSNNLREGIWARHLPDTTITINYFRGNIIEDKGTLVRGRDEGRRIYDN